MRSPEEVWDEIEDGFDSVTQWGISDDQRARVADLIRTRDAEAAEQVRAEMLADVHNIARVSTLTGTDVRLIIEAIRETNGLHWETSATLAGQPGGPFRRLVGPWEPVEP